MKKVLFSIMLTFIVGLCYSQFNENMARKELERIGLGDEEVRERLSQRGINVDLVDINNPAEIFELEKNLREVISELEKEKAQNSLNSAGSALDTIQPITNEEKKVIAKQADEISDAIDEGATLQEAVSEKLLDAQDDRVEDASTYGQQIFRSQNVELYRKSQDIKPPASYVLGVGDIISVSIWGYSEEDLVFEINKEGYIKPNGIPRIYLKGIRLGDARSLLSTRFSKYYRFNQNQFEVALSYGRTINVSIVGEVFNFGSFNLPAINTAFNALVASGGPNNYGSVRNIKLKRYGEEDQNIDVYKYLIDPSYANSFYLEEKDVIYVPVAEKLVTIKGAVIRPNRYELKSVENLIDLLQFCGGLKASANLQNIQLKRFENNIEKLIDINLNQILKENSDYSLKNGDVITVLNIPDKYKNKVTLGGAVATPGEYALNKNDRVSDLLSKTVISDDAYLDIAYLRRPNFDSTFNFFRLDINDILNNKESVDNIVLENGDELVLYKKSRFGTSQSFKVSGSVRRPGEFILDASGVLRLSDAIIMAGGLKKFSEDFAYIKRKNPDSPNNSSYIRVNIEDAVNNISGENNIEILPEDEIVTYNKEFFSDKFFVNIDGEIRKPGRYNYDSSLKLSDIIIMAGGLKYTASRQRIDLYRLDIDDNQKTKTLAARIELDENGVPRGDDITLEPFDLVVVRNAPEFEELRTVAINGEVKFPGQYAILNENESLSDIVLRAGGLTDEAFIEGIKLYRPARDIGYVSVDFEEALNNPRSSQNIAVLAYDRITVPKRNDLVTILGEVNSFNIANSQVANNGRIVVPYEEGKSAKYYVEKYAGGFNDNADKGNISVTSSTGIIQGTRKFLWWNRYPSVEKGSIINVRSKKVEIQNDNDPIDWNSILTNSVAQATSILTLLLLVQRLD